MFTEASHLIGEPAIAAQILPDYHFLLDVEVEKLALAALLTKYPPEMDFAAATLVRAHEDRVRRGTEHAGTPGNRLRLAPLSVSLCACVVNLPAHA